MSVAAGHEGNGSFSSLANSAVPGQPEALLWAYADEEAHGRILRSITAAEHQAAITAWLFALDLFATAFAPNIERGTSPTTTPAGDLYFPLRCEMLARAARGAKPTLDLILSGVLPRSVGPGTYDAGRVGAGYLSPFVARGRSLAEL
jgi:hypothetical protein